MGNCPPVVWMSHKHGGRCAGCGAEIWKGALIQISQERRIHCAECAGLEDLLFLPSGDTALTRRALALSPRSAVVVRFSRARRRRERRGVLVEEAALERAREECAADASRREAARIRRRAREESAEQDYVSCFAGRVLELFPACPPEEAREIADRACRKHSGRVGRSAAAKALDARVVTLAVRAHVRHRHTPYDALLRGVEPHDARPRVAGAVEQRLGEWRGSAEE